MVIHRNYQMGCRCLKVDLTVIQPKVKEITLLHKMQIRILKDLVAAEDFPVEISLVVVAIAEVLAAALME
ncbi:hypothetical protein D3C81_1249820 [compost metagenome]